MCNGSEVRHSRVLIADDQPNSRELLRILFEHHGCEVSEASNGPEAVSVALATHPHLVLLDLGLPGLDGYAAIRQFRVDGDSTPCSIIALSETPEDTDVLRQAGFNDCITKPVVFSVLNERIPAILAS